MVTTTETAIGLPFTEAIDFFKGKTLRPTVASAPNRSWDEIWNGAHSHAFQVAGATTTALVSDFRDAVAKALEQGTTMADFRKEFDAITAKHGWMHNGSPGWRAQIIYETNLSTAYAAGRYAQMTEPDTLEAFPYWQYVHSGSQHPRLQHLAWDGLTLRADDPFWSTHYPPNGWRCGCRVRPLSDRGLARQGRTGPDTAPPIETRPFKRVDGTIEQVPVGIDPGFGYNPGEAWRRPVPTGPSPKPVGPQPRLPTEQDAERLRAFVERPPATGQVLVATVRADVQKHLGAKTGDVVLSAETAVKQAKHHPDIKPDDYMLASLAIADPNLVFDLRARHVGLLLVAAARPMIAIVKVTDDGGGLFLQSVYWIKGRRLRQFIRATRLAIGDHAVASTFLDE